MESGKFGIAMKNVDNLVELIPEFAGANYTRGILYQKKNQPHLTIWDLSKAIALNPEFAEAYNHRGIVHESESRYDRAFSVYTEAIKLNSEFEAAYANRGTIVSKLGNKEAACSDW